MLSKIAMSHTQMLLKLAIGYIQESHRLGKRHCVAFGNVIEISQYIGTYIDWSEK